MKKTILKIKLALSIPATNGYVAKTIGTAPRKPTQETNNLLRLFILKEERLIKTLSGRATKIKKAEINNPIPMIGNMPEGFTNNPKVKNKTICINHVKPSNALMIVFL
jgi:hypothetical protein